MRHNHERGFTMVELLAAIAISPTIAALTLPVLGRAKSIAQAINCLSIHTRYVLAIIVYSRSSIDTLILSNSRPASFILPTLRCVLHARR